MQNLFVSYRVPMDTGKIGKRGKMGLVFPVREKFGFIYLWIYPHQ